MAGTPALAVPVIGATALTVTTASFTPPAGDMLLMMLVCRGPTSAMPTFTDSNGETWTSFGAGSSMTSMKSRMYWKISTGIAQTITVTTTAGTQVAVIIVRASSVGTDFSNFKMDSHATTTTRAVTMDAFAVGSGCIYFINASAGGGWAQPTGYTEITDTLPATNTRIVCGYDISSPAATISSLGGGVDSTMYAIELKLPSAGGSVVKVWSGSAWVEKPTKVWDGSAWVAKPLKVWNGSAWV